MKIAGRCHLKVVATLTLRFTSSYEKMKFSIMDVLVNMIKSAVSCEFGYTLTEEILNGKLDFSCSASWQLTMTKVLNTFFKHLITHYLEADMEK